jgi:hypothetical protein
MPLGSSRKAAVALALLFHLSDPVAPLWGRLEPSDVTRHAASRWREALCSKCHELLGDEGLGLAKLVNEYMHR